jgi:hypothetical protein
MITFGALLLHLDVSRRLAAEEDAALRDLVEGVTRAALALHDEPPSA